MWWRRLCENLKLRTALASAQKESLYESSLDYADRWRGSTLNGYISKGNDKTFRLKFRVSRRTFQHLVDKLSEHGYILSNSCRSAENRITARFKVAVVMYFLAGNSSGSVQAVADAAYIEHSTAMQYIDELAECTLKVLRHIIYMPSTTPPSPEGIQSIRKWIQWHPDSNRKRLIVIDELQHTM